MDPVVVTSNVNSKMNLYLCSNSSITWTMLLSKASHHKSSQVKVSIYIVINQSIGVIGGVTPQTKEKMQKLTGLLANDNLFDAAFK